MIHVISATATNIIRGGAPLKYPPPELTGTAVPDATEAEIVTGGETIIATLDADTVKNRIWDTTIGNDNALTTSILAGLDSAQSETNGWDAEVKANLSYTDLTRTSPTVLTLTLPVAASYNIAADETITWTFPDEAIT